MTKPRAMIFGHIPKLPPRAALWVMPLFLSCLMSGIVSLVNMFKNIGWVENFIHMWVSAWMLSWAVAFPVVLLVLPVVRRLTALLVDVHPPQS